MATAIAGTAGVMAIVGMATVTAYRAPTVYSGGALLQTAGALGYGGYGCNSAYVPYGWSWYRATSC